MKQHYILKIGIVLVTVLFFSCTNEFDYGKIQNAVKTVAYSNVSQTTADVYGEVITDNGASLSDRGICYGTYENPVVSGLKKPYSTAILGKFNCTLDNLNPSTTYYARAYATNSYGTAYGASITFATQKATVPIITSTIAPTSVTATSANSGGVISHNGASNVTSRGVCYSSTTNVPTVANNTTIDGAGMGTFYSTISNLSPNTNYYVRAYAINAIGVAYGDVKLFRTTSVTIPFGISITNTSSITTTTANSGGNITNDGGATIVSKGICWSNSTSSPTIADVKTMDGTGIGAFSSSLTGLLPGTTYYARAYATNSVGTAYSSTISFRTVALTVPTGLTTTNASSLTQTTGYSGGSIGTDGGSTITSKGICWSSITSSPSIFNDKTIDGSGVGTFSSLLTGLSPGTTYYVRAYATNSVGTAYGNVISFTTVGVTIPTGLITTSISSLAYNTANSGGTITTDGGSAITSKGICWSNTTSSPTISNNKTNNGSGTNSYTSSLSGLIANTTYYVRAYATNSVGTAYGNTIAFTTLQNLSVGQSYQGGVIAYIFVPGESGYVSGQTHGLIATTSNQSTGAQWGCSGTSIAGTSPDTGAGLSNTSAIVRGCFTTTIAAKICDNLFSGGYYDWFLPSYYELNKLYSNKAAIGGLSPVSYWCSTQNSSTTAYSINFNTGSPSSSSKNSFMYVRAIRKF